MEVGDRIDEWVNQYVRGVLSEKDRIELLRWLGGLLSMKNNFGKCCESQYGYLLLVNGVSWMIYSREHGIKLRLL